MRYKSKKYQFNLTYTEARLGWDGMGGTTGHGSTTPSRKYSLALNHPFTHQDFTSGEVIPEDKSLHSHVCSGRSTQTGATLTEM